MMAGLLDKLRSTFSSKSDDDVEREIAELQQERRQFARSTPPRRDNARASLDRLTGEAAARLDALLISYRHQLPGDPTHPHAQELAGLFVLAAPEFAARAHAVIDKAGGFAEIDEATYNKRLAKFEAAIEDRRVELERRQRAAKLDAAQKELEELAKRGASQ
jgi:hypothetical protein